MTAPSIGPNRASSEWLAGTSAALKIRLFLLTLYAILVMPEVEHGPGHRMPAEDEQKDDTEKARKTGFVLGFDSKKTCRGARCQAGCPKNRRRRLSITAAKRS